MTGGYENKKAQVLKASINVFAKYGYHKTTLDDIAKQLGIKKNTLYYYFTNKEAIFNEIIRSEAESLINSLSEEIKKYKSAEKKLGFVLKKIIYYPKERSNLFSISFKIFIEIGEIIENSHKEFRQAIQNIIAEILKNAVKNGELKKHNSSEIAEDIFIIISSLQYKEYHSNQITSFEEIDFPNIEKRVLNVVSLILQGLKT